MFPPWLKSPSALNFPATRLLLLAYNFTAPPFLEPDTSTLVRAVDYNSSSETTIKFPPFSFKPFATIELSRTNISFAVAEI